MLCRIEMDTLCVKRVAAGVMWEVKVAESFDEGMTATVLGATGDEEVEVGRWMTSY